MVLQRISKSTHDLDSGGSQFIKILDSNKCILSVCYRIPSLEQKHVDESSLFSEGCDGNGAYEAYVREHIEIEIRFGIDKLFIHAGKTTARSTENIIDKSAAIRLEWESALRPSPRSPLRLWRNRVR